MRFLSLLAHISSFVPNQRINYSHSNTRLTKAVSSFRTFGTFDPEGKVYRLVPVSSEEAERIPSIELIEYNYIKNLESDNRALNEQLTQNSKMIQSLTADMNQIQSDRLYCMIFEAYQRCRAMMGATYDENGRIDTFLEAVRKGKTFSDDKIVHWMINFESSESAQILKEFRNQYSHQTSNDLNELRLWRTKLIEDSANKKNLNLNEAALNILNVIIDHHLNQPNLGPFLVKNHSKNPKVELVNKLQRKNLVETSRIKNHPIPNKPDYYALYHCNASEIAKLRRSGHSHRAWKMIQMLREENRMLVKEHGNWITKKRRD